MSALIVSRRSEKRVALGLRPEVVDFFTCGLGITHTLVVTVHLVRFRTIRVFVTVMTVSVIF